MKICGTCEYFDGGGENAVRQSVESNSLLLGDCLNRRSPRFQTDCHDTCPVWTRSSTYVSEAMRRIERERIISGGQSMCGTLWRDVD